MSMFLTVPFIELITYTYIYTIILAIGILKIIATNI